MDNALARLSQPNVQEALRNPPPLTKRERRAWRKARPKNLPEGWRRLPEPFDEKEDGGGYASEWGLRVLCSALLEADDRVWLHVSCSRSDRIPTYEELCDVKRIFVGRTRRALQVFPPEAEHVNDHPYCLHLWCCMDGDGMPDFRRGLGTV